ncbi:hypothetical protein GPECTOR_10g1119 [Gonium pectorale]|uniref:FAST kinase leucine-rich domain-containing protein n=1 Tax=Gonium pectorale TaxID=33097 RepID=A0A150GQF2_GONPE|nr:hypothetical protein GPECTOR_10g1119 [Gonium pectorale]|eukprot:KXZ52096.1 hypothetical protein GPECTOR_10g1119 [Gonium pectorale]
MYSAIRGQGGRRQQRSRELNAAALTQSITRTGSVAELEALVRKHRRKFNHIHVAAAIVRLAKLRSGSADGERAALLQPAGQPGEESRPHSQHMQQQGWEPQQQQHQTPQPAAAPRPGRRRPPAGGQPSPLSPPLLADLTADFVAVHEQYDTARQYANVIWALGCLGCEPNPRLLPAAAASLLAADSAKLTGAPPQELSNLALGLAKLGYRDVALWSAIIAAGKQRLEAFKPQELHNLAWAVAAASQDRSMISAAVQTALPQLRRFNPSGLANLLWACATAQCECGELFDGAATVLLAAPPAALGSQDVANTAWAFAKLQHQHPALMAHLASRVLGGGAELLAGAATQELVSMLWAFAAQPPPATALMAAAAVREAAARSGGGGVGGLRQGAAEEGRPAADFALGEAHSAVGRTPSSGPTSASIVTAGLVPQLLAVLLPELARRHDLTPQGASNALWAAGRLQPAPLPAAPLAALLAAAGARAGGMSDQELANALWAAGELRAAGHRVSADSIAQLVSTACCPQRLESLGPPALAQLMAAAAKLRLPRVSRFVGAVDALGQRLLRVLPGCGPQELCVMAASLAEAVHVCRYCNPILLNGLGNVAAARVDRMDPQGLSMLLWSFARAKHYHGPLTSAICRVASPRLREFSDFELSNLVCALAVLECQERQLLVRAARVLVARSHAALGSRPQLRRLPPELHAEVEPAQVALQPRRPPSRAPSSDGAAGGDGGSGRSRSWAARSAAAAASVGGGAAASAASGGLRSTPWSSADSADLDDADGGGGLGAGGAAATAQGHAKSMAKLLWGFAKCNLYNAVLYRLLAAELRPLLRLLTPHELTQVLWAVAYHGHSCPELLEAAASAVSASLPRLCAWDGSVVAWAFAKLGYPHRGLMEALQVHAMRLAEYKEPCLCRLAWACATLDVPLAEPLLGRLHAARRAAAARAAHSSYDGADGEPPPASDAGRCDAEW